MQIGHHASPASRRGATGHDHRIREGRACRQERMRRRPARRQPGGMGGAQTGARPHLGPLRRGEPAPAHSSLYAAGRGSRATTSLWATLALIQGLGPENEAQAALAVNSACLHAACTNVLSRLQPGGGDRRVVYLATAVARLNRAFQGAVETFYRVKRGNKQVIRVEKIEIQPGAQAIVGQVSRG